MKLTAAMMAWDPGTDQVKVGPWPDLRPHWSKPYRMTCGACDLALHDMEPWQQVAMLFIHFHTLTVRDGVPVAAAHQAFLSIDEYRDRISPDILGASA